MIPKTDGITSTRSGSLLRDMLQASLIDVDLIPVEVDPDDPNKSKKPRVLVGRFNMQITMPTDGLFFWHPQAFIDLAVEHMAQFIEAQVAVDKMDFYGEDDV